MRKVITTTENEVATEHWGKSFKDVYAQVAGRDCEITLVKYHDNDIGFVYAGEQRIGNASMALTYHDYIRAYEKLF